MSARDATLRRYVDAYAAEIEGVPYSALEHMQPAPYASIASGGAGTAYVLWRLGQGRRARSWIDASLADRRPAAFELGEQTMSPASFLHGRLGVHWVRALVGGTTRARAIAAFIRAANTRTREQELVLGAAGHLNCARILLARAHDPGLRELAERLAARLSRCVKRRAREPWQAIDAAGFAHHWPGILHALLAWSRFTGEREPWLANVVRAVRAAWRPEVVRIPDLAGSWCNGAAGMLLLWVGAYEAIGDEEFLAAARIAAARAEAAQVAGSDLCCGLGGVAYALLVLDRVDPRAGWRGRARDVAVRAIGRPSLHWPNGLYRGHPGLVCLALDLLARQPAGFPAVDA